jgi:hypothetical protein
MADTENESLNERVDGKASHPLSVKVRIGNRGKIFVSKGIVPSKDFRMLPFNKGSVVQNQAVYVSG